MKKTVLIVDDDSMVLELLLLFVKDICHVISADSARKALDIIATHDGIAGLITDFNLQDPQGIDGLSIATAFKKKNPQSFVVLATGSFLSASQISLINDQLEGILLEKPFQLDALNSAILTNFPA